MWLVFVMMITIPDQLMLIQEKITPELKTRLVNTGPEEKIKIIVHMAEHYPYDELKGLSIKERAQLFKDIAKRSQQPLIHFLLQFPDKVDSIKQFWVFNGFSLCATRDIIENISRCSEVSFISTTPKIEIQSVKKGKAISGRPIEWNIQKVMADSCWTAGYCGDSIIIGHIDTGIDTSHPALRGKLIKWRDFVNGQPNPYDDNGHGTHTAGIICGGDGPGPFPDDIGVAPGVKLVCAKAFSMFNTYIHEAMEWIAVLKADSGYDIRAVNNGWGGPSPTLEFWEDCNTWKSLGILPLFAIGNYGPDSGTTGIPGNYPLCLGVGATNTGDTIVDFSSRGPAPDSTPWNDPQYWYRYDWTLTKPDIVAPGVNIRSSEPDGGYSYRQGTDMALSHISGAVAILCEKNPNLPPEELYNILLNNTDEIPPGAPYPNNDYGWGRLNIWKALQNTPAPNQPWIRVLYREITDPIPGGNGNGLLEPGEIGEMVVTIKNVDGDTAYNTTGVLKSYDNYVTVQNETYLFGDLAPDETVSNSSSPFLLLIHDLTPQGHKAKIGLLLHADAEYDTLDFDDTIFYSIQIGNPPPVYVIYEEDFEYGGFLDSFTCYWDTTGNWNWSTQDFHSPFHSAYSGASLNYATTLTLKTGLDLTLFNEPQLSFWHRYLFASGYSIDTCAVQISTNGGSSWTDLWTYDWLQGDTLPWTELTLPLSSYISNDVRIRFMIDARTAQYYAHWYIDDIKFFAPVDNEPPNFTNTTIWADTSYQGPFTVQSTVTDRAGVAEVCLYYRVNNSTWVQTQMVYQGNDIYSGQIPAQTCGSQIDYYLWAQDNWIFPNAGCDPIGAPDYGYYSFFITGLTETLQNRIEFMIMNQNPAKDKVRLKFILPLSTKVQLTIYDITGRRVKTLIDAILKSGTYEILWRQTDQVGRTVSSGIYFIKFSAPDRGFEQIKKLLLLRGN